MKINLVAPINKLGYGNVGFYVLKALVDGGHEVSLFPIGDPKPNGHPDFDRVVSEAIARSKTFDFNAPSIRIWHQFQMDLFPGKGKRIGWPIFELDILSEQEKHHLSQLEHIFVCSQWAADVVKANGIAVPTTVVPLGVDGDIFKVVPEERASRPYWTKNTTNFINVGKWEKRKGHEELIAAFCAAFEPGDDVELWMINENPFINHMPQNNNDAWRRKYLDTPMGAHIKFFERLDNQSQMRQIFSHVDCGVFPSHAEGWNLEIPELMACGAHIICTNYSGHTAFANNENSFLVEPNGKEIAQDGLWFHGTGNWCTFDMQDLVDQMRNVHKLKQLGKLGINEAGIKTAANLSWKYTAEKIVSAIRPN